MVDDKDYLLKIADEYLDMPKSKQREFQLARRLGMVVRPSQLSFLGSEGRRRINQILSEDMSDRDWEDQINMIIERYI